MSFQDKLEAHYQQTEAAETEAREIEEWIKQISGAGSLLPFWFGVEIALGKSDNARRAKTENKYS